MALAIRRRDHMDARHAAPWPAEKLAATPWLFSPADAAVVSPFGRRADKAPMLPAEAAVAVVVVAHARAALTVARGLQWLTPADGALAPVHAAGATWGALWARGKYVLDLN